MGGEGEEGCVIQLLSGIDGAVERGRVEFGLVDGARAEAGLVDVGRVEVGRE